MDQRRATIIPFPTQKSFGIIKIRFFSAAIFTFILAAASFSIVIEQILQLPEYLAIFLFDLAMVVATALIVSFFDPT